MMRLRALVFVSVIVGWCLGSALSVHAATGSVTFTVPTQYPTVQAAVNAAHAGDRIRVLRGVFNEQVSIDKNLTLVGSGEHRTTIHAPNVLVPGFLGRASIIEIRGGADVRISDISISGPGPNACGSGLALNAGIRVIGGANLDLSSARVTDIVDSPVHDCSHNGTGIAIGGLFTGAVGHATIHDVVVSHYQSNAISAFEPGSTLTVTDSFLDARVDPAAVVFTGGIEVGNGAVAKVRGNVIKGNRCSSPSLACGPDPITQFQAAGLNNGPGDVPGPGTEFADNILSGNDIGIYFVAATGCCRVHDNLIVDSILFGIAIQDGSNEVSNDRIVGGPVGVGVIADFIDTVATLDDERIVGSSVAKTQKIECCGFHATISFN